MDRKVLTYIVLTLAATACGLASTGSATNTTITRRVVKAPEGLAPSPTTTPASSPVTIVGATAAPPSSAPGNEPPSVRLTTVPGTINAPVALVSAPRGGGRLWVADKGGLILELDPASGKVDTLIDLATEVSDGNEQGLLGLTVNAAKTNLVASWTDRDGNTVIAAFPLVNGLPDVTRRRVLLEVDQPQSNHNGGQVTFGPDGFLYVGLGDGGGSGDPQGNGQNLEVKLGKLLRLDIAGSGPATAPPGNPFFDGGGDPTIWAYGLRNPWRFSFDRANGDLWIGDVGQDKVEEIDLLPAAPAGAGRGANLGWRAFEGTSRFDRSTVAPAAMPPIYEYRHADGGCSVAGGYVYRGAAAPALTGWYLYGDYCLDRISVLAARNNGTVEVRDLGVAVPEGKVASFAESADGELYVLAIDPGRIYRIEPV